MKPLAVPSSAKTVDRRFGEERARRAVEQKLARATEVGPMARATLRFTGLTLAALAAFSPGCSKKKEAPPPPTPTVGVTAVTTRDVPIFREWIGSLDGFVNAEIRPQIEGYLLRQEYKEGSVVRSGEALFEIDPREFQAALDQARGNVAQYQASLANAKTTVARYTPLAAQKAISQQE